MSNEKQLKKALLGAMLTSASWVGCAEEFDPYNELNGLRVLAVRADPPDLKAGDTTRIDALIYTEKGDAPSLTWSFCPWPGDPNDGFTCEVDEKVWQQAWKKSGLAGAAPSFKLGSAQEAALALPADLDGLRSLCEAMLVAQASSPRLPPDCDVSWKWTIRLVAEGEGDRIDTVKDITVLLDERAESNANPSLSAFKVQGKDADGATLPRDKERDLEVSVADGSAELYTPEGVEGAPSEAPRREALTFTWFVEGGSTENVRSTYRDGVETLREATRNKWTTPDTQGEVQLFVVVRDHRGGVDFIRRTARISD